MSNISVGPAVSKAQLDELYVNKNKTVWMLKIVVGTGSDEHVLIRSGFTFSKEGLVLTTPLFLKDSIIFARRFEDADDDYFYATVEHLDFGWNLALLRIDSKSKLGVSLGQHLEFASFANEGSLYAGQTLYHIGHPVWFVGSFLSGKVAYQCVDDVPTPKGHLNCHDFESKSLFKTTRFRMLGDLWNKTVINEFDRLQVLPIKDLELRIPIIQLYDFEGGYGFEGGPLFNAKGDIVGVMSWNYNDFQIAIHVTLLKAFLKAFSERGKVESKVITTPSSQAGGSKRHGKEKKEREKKKGKGGECLYGGFVEAGWRTFAFLPRYAIRISP